MIGGSRQQPHELPAGHRMSCLALFIKWQGRHSGGGRQIELSVLTAAIISVIALVLTATAKSTVLPLTAIALPAISRASPVLASSKFTGLLFPPCACSCRSDVVCLCLYPPESEPDLPRCWHVATQLGADDADRKLPVSAVGVFRNFVQLCHLADVMPQYRERRRREYCHQQADSVFCDGLQHRSAAGMTVKRRRLCSALSVRIQP